MPDLQARGLGSHAGGLNATGNSAVVLELLGSGLETRFQEMATLIPFEVIVVEPVLGPRGRTESDFLGLAIALLFRSHTEPSADDLGQPPTPLGS